LLNGPNTAASIAPALIRHWTFNISFAQAYYCVLTVGKETDMLCLFSFVLVSVWPVATASVISLRRCPAIHRLLCRRSYFQSTERQSPTGTCVSVGVFLGSRQSSHCYRRLTRLYDDPYPACDSHHSLSYLSTSLRTGP